MSAWFKRIKKGIVTTTQEKKEAPDGLWHKCPECKATVTKSDLASNLYLCKSCNHHNRINAQEYFEIIFDEAPQLLFENIAPKDYLEFVDAKPYGKRLVDAQKSTGLKDAMTVGVGNVQGRKLVVACMNFNFIGGSMGSVVGEKTLHQRALARAVGVGQVGRGQRHIARSGDRGGVVVADPHQRTEKVQPARGDFEQHLHDRRRLTSPGAAPAPAPR